MDSGDDRMGLMIQRIRDDGWALFLVLLLTLSLWPSHSQAQTANRDHVVVVAPCRDATKTSLGKKAVADLRKALAKRGFSLLSYQQYQKRARQAGFPSRKIRTSKAISKVAPLLKLDGVVLGAAWRERGYFFLSFEMIGVDGRQVFKEVYRLKRPEFKQKYVDRLAGLLERWTNTYRRKVTGTKTTKVAAKPVHPHAATHVHASANMLALVTSNVYMDRSEEWDLFLKPVLSLKLDFAETWSLGYVGEMSHYQRNESLFSHWHKMYMFFNPAWGKESGNEAVIETSVETLRNHEDHASFNHVKPRLSAKLLLAGKKWLRLRMAVDLSYRHFEDDPLSKSFDSWVRTSLTAKHPFRGSFSLRAAYGFRHYFNHDAAVSSDVLDQQVTLGVHIGQSLGDLAGIQLDYSYLAAIGESALLERSFTQAQFTYLGSDFLYSGHLVLLTIKQMLGVHGYLGVSGAYEQRSYAGWPARNEIGELTGRNRQDKNIISRVFLTSWLHTPRPKASRWQPRVTLVLDYRYIKRLSNSYWYETQVHMGLCSVSMSW